MSYVLAIEPRDEQAGILRTAVGPRTSAALTVVGSLAAAMGAIDEEVPHIVLVSALMSPLDEGKLVARLRDLSCDEAPQLLIIPALATPQTQQPKRRLFGRRRSRHEPARCDPSAFADQVSAYLDSVHRRPKTIVRPEPSRPVSLAVKSGAERRAAVRVEGIDWARALVDGAAVDLVDLSATGAQVLAPMVLPPGDRVQVPAGQGRASDPVRGGYCLGRFRDRWPGQCTLIARG